MLAAMFPRLFSSTVLAVALCLSASAFAQTKPGVIEPNGGARPPNADGFYQALRKAAPTGDGIQVKDFTLARQGGNFHFIQGSFYFYAPVNGRTTGAVFLGSGHFELTPEDASERHSLSLLNKSGVMAQDFTTLVLRFSDGTDAKIRKASSGAAGQTPSQAVLAATDLAHGLRNKLHDNFDLRILNDVLTPDADVRDNEYFLASFRMGGLFTGRNVLFTVDPEASPDEVELSTWGDEGSQTWAGFRMHNPQANVSKDFLMMVPIYLQLNDGRTVRLLNLTMKGDMTFDRTIKVGKLPGAPKKMLVNYNADVLSD